MARSTSKKTTRRSRATRKKTVANPLAQSKPVTSIDAATIAAVPHKRSRWQRTPVAERPKYSKISNVLSLTRKTYDLLALNWKLIIGIAVVYGLLNIVLVRGFNGGLDVSVLKEEYNKLFHGGWGNLASGFAIFGLLVSSSNSSAASDAAGAYQTFLVIITSLALVWTFRQLLADKPLKLRIRDSFYKGMYPLVPVILVFLVIAIQLIPMLVGGMLYSTVISQGIAITTSEIIAWFVVFIAMIVWSLLLITPSVLALFIASLPDMTPRRALSSARKLVKFRRFTVLRKLLFLPVLLLIALSVVMIPIILIAPVLAQWVFFVLSMFILPTVIAYIYTLYRELLNE